LVFYLVVCLLGGGLAGLAVVTFVAAVLVVTFG
jgi:hypothetical protein